MSQYPSIYNSKRWKALRRDQLAAHPLCWYCLKVERITPANTVDHITPHRGDKNLAFDAANLASTCKACHDVHCDAKDRGKHIAGCDVAGMPLDKSHPWGE